MTINWQDKNVQDRLLIAVIASVDNKISVAEIARLYGGDMTYNAVENYLRKFRREAKDMKDDAAGRDGPAPSPARPRTKKASNVTPKKPGVKTGRVTKKQTPTTKVKTEAFDEEDLLAGGDKDGGIGAYAGAGEAEYDGYGEEV
ncbi:hypothetical protein FB567DRAFT_628638 [Paraphoma chrysanthemicola]|uniref:Uncharacterized protein n=1 Tax=Paraphoma chrysanthemicola TaxID=798071 RepID=A0A8K0R4Y4_9PLEO|nr:hypothetical protein FB567DRAFT_628638 [Paraphoma chrysanthemicola]